MSNSSTHTAIIGGGLMGMALAYRLARAGQHVEVFEAAEQLGGLSTWADYGPFTWDRFYHVILPSDRALIELVRELGLESELHWQRTYTGYFVDHKMHSISSNIEFLKFKPLSLLDKARLGFTMWYGSKINDWRSLESVTLEDWLVKLSGRSTYEKLWKPLLLAKLGDTWPRVSAVFIWAYIKRLFSARDGAASAESLGHVRGGYSQIFKALSDAVTAAGGTVHTSARIEHINLADGNGLQVQLDGESHHFDKVVCTSPVPVLEQLADQALYSKRPGQGDIEYLGVVCVIVLCKRQLVPFYVVNIADAEVPFTGLIGMSNVVGTDQTGDMHMYFLPRYMLSTHEDMAKDDDWFKSQFIAGLKRMVTDLSDDEINAVHVHRARRVQPLQVLNYSERVPEVTTQHPDFLVLNTSQFVNATLNNNEVISAVNRFVKEQAHALALTNDPETASTRAHSA